jgi:hypothetical protein
MDYYFGNIVNFGDLEIDRYIDLGNTFIYLTNQMGMI